MYSKIFHWMFFICWNIFILHLWPYPIMGDPDPSGPADLSWLGWEVEVLGIPVGKWLATIWNNLLWMEYPNLYPNLYIYIYYIIYYIIYIIYYISYIIYYISYIIYYILYIIYIILCICLYRADKPLGNARPVFLWLFLAGLFSAWSRVAPDSDLNFCQGNQQTFSNKNADLTHRKS